MATAALTRRTPNHVKCPSDNPSPRDRLREKRSALKFSMVRGDLFSCSATSSLAHCVSADMCMGKGIAVEFKKRYGRVEELKKQGTKAGGVAILQHEGRFVYYLVTKQRYFHKPTCESLESSLRSMRDHCVANGVEELSMPTIGCGLDRLNWTDVEQMIKRVFSDISMSITIYHL